ncbi:MAG: type II secretion system protein GspG [Planctomycetes bacterium]|nr:type II secretion system protein GspG [Planctomycetota bacterium]
MNFILLLSLFLSQDNAETRRKDLIESEIKTAIERLKTDDDINSAYIVLTELKDYSIPHLINLFRESKPAEPKDDTARLVQTRILICSIFTEIGRTDDAVVDVLLAATNDFAGSFENTVAASAVRTLGEIGLPHAGRIITVLIKLLDSEKANSDKTLKTEIIKAFGNLRAVEAEDKLLGFLQTAIKSKEKTGDDRLSHAVAAVIINALEKINSRKAVEELIKKEYIEEAELKDPFSEYQPISFFAARAISKLAGKDFGDFQGSTADVEKSVKKCQEWAKSEREKKELEERRKDVAEKKSKTSDAIKTVVAAIESYRSKNGKLPEKLEDLKSVSDNIVTKDAWGKDLTYRTPGTGSDFDLLSFGDDNKEGGSDLEEDVWNHDKWVAVKISKTKETLTVFKNAIEEFKKDCGRYPKVLEELTTKPQDVQSWKEGGYISDKALHNFQDAFGRVVVYKTGGDPAKPYDLVSLGNDGKEGGTSDADKDITLADLK